MTIIEKFRNVPVDLGIRFSLYDFNLLNKIINEAIEKIHPDTQQMFRDLILSFKTDTNTLTPNEIKELHDTILSSEEYTNELNVLIENVKKEFNHKRKK